MRKLYKYYVDCGRMGEINGVFVADDVDVKNAIGKNVYFGDILGKHSDVHGTIAEEEITVLTDDQDFIDKAIQYRLVPAGYNPLEYVAE